MKRKAVPPESELEDIVFYQKHVRGFSGPTTDRQIFRANDGRYFLRDWYRNKLEPITETDAIKDWVKGAAHPRWVEIINGALSRPGHTANRRKH